ncbi:MAG: preprotein translocase subunit SecG [Candidatus Brocadiae bacterium]|nr:preprotein translocase subunit SecG [Candidatus Brocadiia bacterium]
MGFLMTLLWIVFVGDALLLVLIVLLQSGRGGGLSGMLGGGAAAESALGPKSGLSRITGWMAGIFFLLAIVIGRMNREESAMPDVKTAQPGQEAPAKAPKDTTPPKSDATPAEPAAPEASPKAGANP